MTQEEKLYRPLDDYLKRLKKKVKESFAPLMLAGFDKLNVIRLVETTTKLYEELDEFNRKEYVKLVRHAEDFVIAFMEIQLPSMDSPDFVDSYLIGYDPITQYVYVKEVDRKRMRLNESILAAREYQDIVKMQKAIKKAGDLWFTQSSQYALDLMLAAMKDTYIRAGTKKWQWTTVMDGHECEDCRDLNGKVFAVEDYPEPQHYGCRCYPLPVA